MPRDMSDVLAREKEIRFSSRTRMNTNEAMRSAEALRIPKTTLHDKIRKYGLHGGES